MIRKLVLLDIDGTLLHGGGIGRAAKAVAMKDVFGTDGGVETHPFGGKTDWQILNETLIGAGISAATIQAKLGAYQEQFAKHMAAMIDDFPVAACPGAHDLVNTLHADEGILMGIVTGNTSLTAPIKLRAGGFDPAWFPIGAYGNEADNRPALPRLAWDRAQTYANQTIAAQDVIVVGDTALDTEAGRAMNAVNVLVKTGYESLEKLQAAQPDYLLDDLTTFLDIVLLEQNVT
ncbi:MAG: HAD family hydrolase [Aggregatilineales bacterium]